MEKKMYVSSLLVCSMEEKDKWEVAPQNWWQNLTDCIYLIFSNVGFSSDF